MFGQKPFIERLMGERTAPSFGSSIDPFPFPQPSPAPMQFEVPSSPATAMLEQPDYLSTAAEGMEAISRELIPLAANDESAKPLLFAWLDLREKLETIFNASKDERRRTIETKIMELTTAGRAILDRIAVLKGEHATALTRYNAHQETVSVLRSAWQSLVDLNPDKNLDESWASDAERAEWKSKVDAAQDALESSNVTSRILLGESNEIAGKMNSENAELLKIREHRRLLRLELKDGTTRVLGSGLQGRVGNSALP